MCENTIYAGEDCCILSSVLGFKRGPFVGEAELLQGIT